jgi:hypothetical protein
LAGDPLDIFIGSRIRILQCGTFDFVGAGGSNIMVRRFEQTRFPPTKAILSNTGLDGSRGEAPLPIPPARTAPANQD